MPLADFLYRLTAADLSGEAVVLCNQELVRQRVREEELRDAGRYNGPRGGLLFSERPKAE